MSASQSQYELFHEWLNNCPTKIEDYEDNIDSVTIRFGAPFDNIKEDNELAESIKNTSEITPDTSYASAENKRLNTHYEMVHDSEGC